MQEKNNGQLNVEYLKQVLYGYVIRTSVDKCITNMYRFKETAILR